MYLDVCIECRQADGPHPECDNPDCYCDGCLPESQTFIRMNMGEVVGMDRERGERGRR